MATTRLSSLTAAIARSRGRWTARLARRFGTRGTVRQGPASANSPSARPRDAAVGMVAALLMLAAVPPPAHAFGTINSLGQHAEHERITRAALACSAAVPPSGACIQPATMDQLAGKRGSFGAVGAPDRPHRGEFNRSEPHCTDADYLDRPRYPSSRKEATRQLDDCLSHLRKRWYKAVAEAEGLLFPDRDQVDPAAVRISPDCEFPDERTPYTKCEVLEHFGRSLHGIQDFYSHSNWADEAHPRRPIGVENPPGLNRSVLPSFVNLRIYEGPPDVPRDLLTSCYSHFERIGLGCRGRVTHTTLNKDNGIIDPVTGKTRDPSTDRGEIKDNFAQAVRLAIADTRRHWKQLREELVSRYGPRRGELMACAISQDDPVQDCRAPLLPPLPFRGP